MRRLVVLGILSIALLTGLAFADPTDGNDADGGYAEPTVLCSWAPSPLPALPDTEYAGLCQLVP